MVGPVSFDVLIVLGCRVHGGELGHAALRRVERAARAYHELGAREVVAAGGKVWQGAMEAEVFARGLVERGVPEASVLLERESLTTRGNARGLSRLLYGRSGLSLGLVTCDWHMRRALGLFEREGLRVVPLPAASPERAPHLALARSARERASSIFDGVLHRLRWRA